MENPRIHNRDIDISMEPIYGSYLICFEGTKILANITSHFIPSPLNYGLEKKLHFTITSKTKSNKDSFKKEISHKQIIDLTNQITRIFHPANNTINEQFYDTRSFKSWIISVHLTLLHDEGNLLDSCIFASLIVLTTRRIHIFESKQNKIFLSTKYKKNIGFTTTNIFVSTTCVRSDILKKRNPSYTRSILESINPMENAEYKSSITFILNSKCEVCELEKIGGNPVNFQQL
jgi:exosome complex RNA-binding protein Rrp42 (RNase PH superfamily)